MARQLSDNKLSLENITVVYNEADDKIEILTSDPEVQGLPFKLTLNRGTQSEDTLRTLLEAYGMTPHGILPKYASTDTVATDIASISDYHVPLGVGDGGSLVTVDFHEHPNMFVHGLTGHGKTYFLTNVRMILEYLGWDVDMFTLFPYSPYDHDDSFSNNSRGIENRARELCSELRNSPHGRDKPLVVIVDPLVALFDPGRIRMRQHEDPHYTEVGQELLDAVLNTPNVYAIVTDQMGLHQQPDFQAYRPHFPNIVEFFRDSKVKGRGKAASNGRTSVFQSFTDVSLLS